MRQRYSGIPVQLACQPLTRVLEQPTAQQAQLVAPDRQVINAATPARSNSSLEPIRLAEPTAGSSRDSQSKQPMANNSSAQASASTTADVRNPHYRRNNLQGNNIHIRHPDEKLPAFLEKYVRDLHLVGPSLGLSKEKTLRATSDIMELESGCTEDEVAYLLNKTAFPAPLSDPDYPAADAHLARSFGSAMPHRLVPLNPATAYRVCTPRPYQQYGYSAKSDGCFLPDEYLGLAALDVLGEDMTEETLHHIRFPFLTVEIKAVGGTRGDLWVAANECAAAAAVCLNAVREVNDELLDGSNRPQLGGESLENYQVENLAYSIAVDNNIARLYIAWLGDDRSYNLQEIDIFVLSRPWEFGGLCANVRHILSWGARPRLKQIKDVLRIFSEECRSDMPKSLRTPLDEVVRMIRATPPPNMQQPPPPRPASRKHRCRKDPRYATRKEEPTEEALTQMAIEFNKMSNDCFAQLDRLDAFKYPDCVSDNDPKGKRVAAAVGSDTAVSAQRRPAATLSGSSTGAACFQPPPTAVSTAGRSAVATGSGSGSGKVAVEEDDDVIITSWRSLKQPAPNGTNTSLRCAEKVRER